MRFLFWRHKSTGPVGPIAPAIKTTVDDMEENSVVLWSQKWVIDFVDAFLMRWCQFFLMVGCILGTFGLYATSFNLTAQPAFNGVWAAIQAVSIDGLFFSVWSVWRRSTGKGWLRTWYFFIGVLLMIVAAMVNGVVSFTELHKVATISLTMQQLHIDETVFSWARSVLVVLVAVLITTLPRGGGEKTIQVEQTKIEEVIPSTPEPSVDVDKVLQALQNIQEQNRQALNVTIEHFTNVTVEAVKEAMSSLPFVSSVPQIEESANRDEEPIEDTSLLLSTVDEEPIKGTISSEQKNSSSYSIQIENLYTDNPAITAAQTAKIVGCNYRTAQKWLARVKPGGAQEEE